MNYPRMTIVEARNNIDLLHSAGLISDFERRRYRTRLLQIQARTDLHWTHKHELYAIWGCKRGDDHETYK